MSGLHVIKLLAERGTLDSADPPLSKDEFFTGDPPLILNNSLHPHIAAIIECLASNNEFITSTEWLKSRKHQGVVPSLSELCAPYARDNIGIRNGYVCTKGTRGLVPPAPGEVVEPLPERNAPLVVGTPEQSEKFWEACVDNNLPMLKQLWQKYDIDLNMLHSDGLLDLRTPLMVAAGIGSDNVMDFLLAVGANPDARSQRGYSALLLAALNGYDKAVLKITAALQRKYRGDPQALVAALTHETSKLTPLMAVDRCCSPDTIDTLNYIHARAKQGLSALDVPDTMFVPGLRPASYAGADVLARYGDRITREQLLAPGEGNTSLLYKATDNGQLRQALEMLHASGERLTHDDLMEQEKGVIDKRLNYIARMGKLETLFTPKYWANHVREMSNTWARVPLIDKKQLDGNDGRTAFKRLYQEANALSLRSLGGGAGIGGS